jgi:glucosylceramidase
MLGVALSTAILVLAWPRSGGAVTPSAAGTRVAVYLTTADLKRTLDRQPDLIFRAGVASSPDLITVNPTLTDQRLTSGFGVAMTDTSAFELDRELPSSLRDQVMRRLFSRVGGIGLSFLRVPIGGSDYVVGQPYTYDDLPSGQTDPTLAHFSIAHDATYILPMIREALALNPRISIMANPWTPPAWMKTDDQLVTTTGPAGQLLPQDYGVYAQYLVRFLQGYRAAGVPVQYLGVQNEPLTPLLFVSGIPESFLSPEDEGNLIHNYVAPALGQAGLHQQILAYDDHFETDLAYIPPVMAEAGGDVAGFAYHCYFSDPSSMRAIHSQYPQQLLLETECSSKLSNIYPEQMAIRVLRNGAQGVQLWNAAIDQNGGPKIGSGCQGITGPWAGQPCIAPVTVNTTTHTYALTSDYWALAQFSKFIQLGAVRIDSSDPSNCTTSPTAGWDCGLEDVALKNPDGSQVIVLTAHDGRSHLATIAENGKSVSYTVPDGGIVTFVVPPPRPAITDLHLAHRVRAHSGLRASFELNEAASVRARLVRLAPHGRRRTVATRVVLGEEGVNSLAFTDSRTRARLTKGRYRLVLRAVDAGGDASAPVAAEVRVTAGAASIQSTRRVRPTFTA